MRRPAAGITILFFLFISCTVTEKQLPGIYKPGKGGSSRLILSPDHRFELALLNPASDTLLFPSTAHSNFSSTGTWQLSKKKTIRLITDSIGYTPFHIDDSISRFTNISSFHFWNRFGEPISIRYIRIPPGRPKPHFGNGLYFFAQDFNPTDTLRFYFDGYEPVSYPGSISPAMGNNIHKITLTEPHRNDAFREMELKITGKSLKSPDTDLNWRKK